MLISDTRKLAIRLVALKCFLPGLCALLLVVTTACSQAPPSHTLTIAAAASLRPPLEQIAALFAEETGTSCQLVFASSGKLTAQIEAGAPYDVFLSANRKYTDVLVQIGSTSSPASNFTTGRLCLWSMRRDIALDPINFSSDDVKRIALANPKTAPYGHAAIVYLQHLPDYPQISPKLVYGESVGQAGQFVASGSAEVGLVALSLPLSLPLEERGRYAIVDSGGFGRVDHWGVALGDSQVAGRFLDFLHLPRAVEIFEQYGFVPEG